MFINRLMLAMLAVVLGVPQLQAAEERKGENLIEAKIALPKGDTYQRGATDPVANLVVDLTLTNRTPKENLNKETISYNTVSRFTPEETAALAQKAGKEKMTPDELRAEAAKKKTAASQDAIPVNKDSLGVAYTAPQLGSNENVSFIITRQPEEGEPAPADAKPVLIQRDLKTSFAGADSLLQRAYVAPGESSPVYSLEVGKYYLIRNPGKYSIKAVLPLLGDNQKPAGRVESNEETFRLLPYKIVETKIDDLKANWTDYERGIPNFDYMLYQVKTTGGWDEIYYMQRVPVSDSYRWEWARLCSVKAGTQVQVAQIGYKKVAVVAAQAKGDAGFYTLDFNSIGPKITAKILELKDGAPPKLKVEGGTASVE